MSQKSSSFIQSKSEIIGPIDIVIYHANCLDGFASSWVVHQKYPNAKYIAASHGAKIKEDIYSLQDKKILFVDFCYPKEIIEHLLIHNQISILDHHITTLNAISPLLEQDLIQGEINLHYSGASLTWKNFFQDKPMPELIKYIEDIDIWNLVYPETKAVCLALGTYPFSFSKWSELMQNCQGLKREGNLMQKVIKQIQSELLKHTHKMKIDEFVIPAVNAPAAFSSEIGNHLAQKKPFAAVYYCKGDEYKISLRSTKKGEDVAKIAERFAGGGHRGAASFSINLSQQDSTNRVKIYK